MATEQDILNILADGKYHSGTDLGKQFSVSRAAIGKTIKKIENNFSLNIFAVKGKGYRLEKALELLDESKVRSNLNQRTNKQLNQLEIYFDIDSTNHYLNNKSIDGAASGFCVLAEQQTKGVGRRGRAWISPFGHNLYLSLLWRFQCGAAQLGCLSLFIAIAIVRALKKVGIEDAGVKWPNDIYWKNKKLAGILLEMRGEISGPSAVVIGVGLNVSMPSSSDSIKNISVSSNIDSSNIDQPWVDLETILEQKVERNKFTAHVINALFDVLNELPEQESKLLDEWQAMDILKDQKIEVRFADKTIKGLGQGITRDGALIVRHEGKDIICHSGDVSIRRG